MTDYDPLIERMLHYFTGPDFSEEVLRAKAFFFEKTSVLSEDSGDFETRMSQFLDWYIFSRPLSSQGETPVQYSLKIGEQFGDWGQTSLINLVNHKHSLFEFEKIKNENVVLYDLFDRKRLTVKNSPWTIFHREELFEARLIPKDDAFVFARGICIHPAEARRDILKESKRFRKKDKLERERFMLTLIKVRHKYEQYRHVKWEAIFAAEMKTR